MNPASELGHVVQHGVSDSRDKLSFPKYSPQKDKILDVMVSFKFIQYMVFYTFVAAS